jgi:pyridinium-3,5-bisthiocarboxylic acid mononucleotide nickel chelatase
MARVLYIDCFSGAAGDMLLGGFLDAGLPEVVLRDALGSLGVGHELRVRRVVRAGVTATKIDVVDPERGDAAVPAHSHDEGEHGHTHAHGDPHHVHGEDGHRSLASILHLVGHAKLSPAARARASRLFTRLAEAEAAIHNMSVEHVHLHEVGAVDSIIDIVGCVVAFEWFGANTVVVSPLNVGSGQVSIAHGVFPVPAPATLRLLAGAPIYSEGPAVELLTPTGALVLSDYATSYGTLPAMTVERVGYGAGTKDFPGRPNIVRVVVGEAADPTTGATSVVKIECEIDDMNPQLFGPLSDHLFEVGALDVFLTPVLMKKGRPGTLVTVIAPDGARAALADVLFRQTTTIGVRYAAMAREVLERHFESVEVRGAAVRVKVAGRDGDVLGATPEFDDCLQAAQALGLPVKTVQAEAMQAWLNRAQGLTKPRRPE